MDGSLLFICDITNLRVHQRLSLTPLLMVLVLSPHPPLPHPPLLLSTAERSSSLHPCPPSATPS